MTDEQRTFVEQHMGLAHYVARKFKRYRSIDREDILQMAKLGLCRAVIMFDADRGVKFSTFAVPVMLHEILMCTRRKHHPTVSLDAKATKGDQRSIGDTIPTFQDFDERLTTSDMYSTIKRMPKRQRQVVALAAAGYYQMDAARMLGISQSTVSRALDAAREELGRATV